MPHKPPDSSKSVPRAGRGRPKDPGKRESILSAAKQLFSVQGLAGTSMDGIADCAGVSKLTLYSHFNSKDELFRATVMAKCSEHTPDALFDALGREPLRDRLLQIGQGFVNLVLDEEPMSLYRMMAAEGGGESKLGQLFWEAGPERTMQRFAQLLAAASEAGELVVPNPRRSAGHFFFLLKGEHHLRCMVGAGSAPTRAERRTHVEDVVELFMRAFAPPAPKRGPGSR